MRLTGDMLIGRRAVHGADRAAVFLKTPELEDEVFGHASTIVRCKEDRSCWQSRSTSRHNWTATIAMDRDDVHLAKKLVPILERKAGRVLVNGFPTGVEVCHAMVLAGPFPATADNRVTSVGSTSIERFLRPVCYQDCPLELLPQALADDNPPGLWRRRDGQIVNA